MEGGASGGGGGRNTRYMIEMVGARVIRGPDWKWGKQVSVFVCGFFAVGQFAIRGKY